MYLTWPELTIRHAKSLPKFVEEQKELLKQAIIHVRSGASENLRGFVTDCDDAMALAGHLNLLFAERLPNHSVYVLHLELLAHTLAKESYWSTINAFEAELADLSRNDNYSYFVIADMKDVHNMDAKPLITYLTRKTSVKSCFLVNKRDVENILHVQNFSYKEI
jgi:hypothetical protein